jgi:plasmid stability protein
MPVLTVRNVPEEVHRALRMRAASRGHSTEAEVRDILADAVKPAVRIGDALARIGRKAGLTDRDFDILTRDKTPAEPVRFE